jgi:hypothetical protein
VGEKAEKYCFYLFSAGAMYGFGDVTGSVGACNSISFALNYAANAFGPNRDHAE